MANFKYVHDIGRFVVYKFPVEPRVIESIERKKRVGWQVSMEVEITRRDNRLVGGRWELAVADFPSQYFDSHYSREDVIFYFYMRHTPKGIEISEDEYLPLRDMYYSEAIGNNRPN